jgi:CheY-like chemotaxis protein/HPt (histidine-containing phosphotransfer) domain-containing protein
VKKEKRKIYFKPAKILLVEDNQMNQELAVSLLDSVGLTAMIANNGQEALDLLEKNSFNLVLMDLQMPVMDGLTATKAIRGKEDDFFKKVPIIAMSARAFQKDKEECFDAGMNDYVVKPIDPSLLYEVLSHYLDVAAEGPEIQNRTIISTTNSQLASDDAEFIAQFSDVRNLDARAGLYHANSNRTLYLKILQGFVADYGSNSLELRKLIERAKYEDATRVTHTIKGLCGTIGSNHVQELAAKVENSLSQKNPDFAEYNLFEKALQELIGDLSVALNGIASEQSTHIEKKDDPQANEKLKKALVDLHAAVESCSSTQCKRIIDGLERIVFAKNQEELINQLKDQVDDYDFGEAEKTIKELEKTL